MKQQYFPNTKPQREFGGSLLVGKRKSERPLSTQYVHHLVLKAENLQFRFPGVSLTKARAKISRSLQAQAKTYNITIEAYSINWNHLHSALNSKIKKTTPVLFGL